MSQLTFNFTALASDGTRSKGEILAGSEAEAYRQILARNLRPLRISTGKSQKSQRRSRGVSVKELSHLTRQFAVLMEASIPIVDGLRALAEQESNDHLKAVLVDVSDRIESGSNITEAMTPYRATFGDVYLESIRAAETSGRMVSVLEHLSDILERQYETTKGVKGALMYPACVVVALALAMVFLMVGVVPKFTSMFESRGVELPLPTQIVVAMSDFLVSYWYVPIIVIGGSIFGIRHGLRSAKVRYQLDRVLHKIPFIKTMLKGLAVSRFNHILGVTLRSGLSLIDALEMSGRASGRPLLEADTTLMCKQVEQGGRLSDVMTECTYLPPFARRMLITGEETADLSKLCDVVARHYDREVGHLTKAVTTALEPILIAGLAGIVLIIALAIFLPMWNMASLL